MTIKAIFLDFYGTVVHEDEKIINRICQQIKENSPTKSTVKEIGGVWWEELARLFRKSYGANFRYQRTLEESSLQKTLSHFHSSLDETTLCEEMFDYWMRPDIFPDSVTFLSDNTLPVYILSNIDRDDILKAMKAHQISVEDVITSEDVKSYKPRPEMFNYALELSGLTPSEVIHVGDSLSSDVAGANHVGIRSVWVNRTDRVNKGEKKPDYEIKALDELTHIINSIGVSK
ncbi:HAD family hydrolase [Bacillus alkalicellulosilyticus]|uniref:HAD family hydrolase n=1 Tax=Alkalihalobacterium alkalicellulosilyticum TaxID=1912214 RepID=UPI00099837D4|nr:HAD family hydrolase [Bacillus alkalicellulosilyticus]